jgi:hypothetical protein
LGWENFKEWRYRSVLAHAVTEAVGRDEVSDPFRPVDILFGEMTNRYITVQVLVHKDDEVIMVKNALMEKGGQAIYTYYNQHKDITVESVDVRPLDASIELSIKFSDRSTLGI